MIFLYLTSQRLCYNVNICSNVVTPDLECRTDEHTHSGTACNAPWNNERQGRRE